MNNYWLERAFFWLLVKQPHPRSIADQLTKINWCRKMHKQCNSFCIHLFWRVGEMGWGGGGVINGFQMALSTNVIIYKVKNYFVHFSTETCCRGSQKNCLNELPKHMFKILCKKKYHKFTHEKFTYRGPMYNELLTCTSNAAMGHPTPELPQVNFPYHYHFQNTVSKYYQVIFPHLKHSMNQ